MKALLLLFFPLLITSCNSGNKNNHPSEEDKDTTAFSQYLKVPNEEVVLLPEAREQVVTWVNYITAQNEIDNLKSSDLNQVIENARPLAQIMQSLKTSVPDSLQSTAVNARVNVLATKAKVLEQLATKRNRDPEKIARTAEEIPVEFNNFKLQLNELFLKTLEDFEMELDLLEEERKQIEGAKIPGDSLTRNQI